MTSSILQEVMADAFANIPVYGYLYDVRTGQLEEVPEATAAGRAG
jgi:hypothetical protein